jgi:hypothetical protein
MGRAHRAGAGGVKRSPMARGKGFARAEWTPPPKAPLVPLTREVRISDGKARASVALPKHPPLRSEPYRRWVASLACAHCGRAGPSQCAHGDEGKGMAIKAGDETCFPLCADGPGRRGCHSLIGASGLFTRDQRRMLERTYAAFTRADAKESGAWPKAWADTQPIGRGGQA